MRDLKKHFLLDPSVTFLNHGSFGATPVPVFEAYLRWQRRLEHQPVLFLGREYNDLLLASRIELGKYLNADPQDLVYIPNATHGVNIIARSLQLATGDEILTSDHEYGACDYTWEFITQKTGARYIHQPISLPVTSAEEIVEQFWKGVTPRTKVIYFSHITSPTALRMPVEEICQRAKEAGILTVIDSAHAPGQIPVDLQSLNADFVFGNCHKWMLSPKVAAFLYVRRELQDNIDPLIVSWGFHPTPETSTGSRFVDFFQWTGTNDPAAALAVPDAIRFMAEHQWDAVRLECHALLKQGIQQICELTELPPAYPLESDLFFQMGIAPLPSCDIINLKKKLYDEFKVEAPLIQWQDKQFVRISVQGYNEPDDLTKLVEALRVLLRE